MKLKHTKEVVIKVYIQDLDDLINKEFNIKDYETEAAEDLSEDLFMLVTKEVSSHEQKIIDWTKTTGGWDKYNTNTYMNYLCKIGVIEAGTYYIYF